jgi:hypothetical protein
MVRFEPGGAEVPLPLLVVLEPVGELDPHPAISIAVPTAIDSPQLRISGIPLANSDNAVGKVISYGTDLFLFLCS